MGAARLLVAPRFFAAGGCYFDWKSLRSMESAMDL
jgi:hypothetical protein